MLAVMHETDSSKKLGIEVDKIGLKFGPTGEMQLAMCMNSCSLVQNLEQSSLMFLHPQGKFYEESFEFTPSMPHK